MAEQIFDFICKCMFDVVKCRKRSKGVYDMGFRFRKSITLLPGVKLNIGKKSVGISLGGKFFGLSLNSRTGARARASLPGTGLSYSTRIGRRRKKK